MSPVQPSLPCHQNPGVVESRECSRRHSIEIGSFARVRLHGSEEKAQNVKHAVTGRPTQTRRFQQRYALKRVQRLKGSVADRRTIGSTKSHDGDRSQTTGENRATFPT
jgi:hypothetical protein